MVRLDEKFLNMKLVKNSRTTEKRDLLKNVQHLHLQEMFIDQIVNISVCKNLTVLYLQSNLITKIENLNSAVNLEQLYLQMNNISKIQNLDSLKKLKKLYLGHNRIAVIEGLDRLKSLEQLHLEKQKLPEGEHLHFDPRSMKAVSRSLRVVNVSGNRLTSFSSLSPLKSLEEVIARNNVVMESARIAALLAALPLIRIADFSGNPVCGQHRYRESAIAAASFLASLDGKHVPDRTREFLHHFEEHRKKLEKRASMPSIQSRTSLDSDNIDFEQVGVTKSTPGLVVGPHLRPRNHVTPVPSSFWSQNNENRNGHILPRPFWRYKALHKDPLPINKYDFKIFPPL